MAKEKQEQYDKKKKKGDNLGKFLYHEKIRKFHPSQSGRNYRDRFFLFYFVTTKFQVMGAMSVKHNLPGFIKIYKIVA